MILSIGLVLSFVLAFRIGYKKKRFLFLLVDSAMGLGIGALSVYLYFALTPPENLGLGVIAFLPAVFIMFSFLNIIMAIIGGIIGTLVGRKKK